MLDLLAADLCSRPLMIHAGKAAAILDVVGPRLFGGDVALNSSALPVAHVAFQGGRPSAARLGDQLGASYDLAGERPYPVIDGVAVIGIEGTLVHKGGYVGMSSGKTSYQGLQTQIVRAERDTRVAGVVLEIDSFGGEVAGAFETADMIHQLAQAKPVLAILTDHACSAAYLMATAARQIVMPELGRAGSIGVISLHADRQGENERNGVRVTVLSAGAHKADFSPYGPLAEDTLARALAGLETMRQAFATAVGRYRGARFTAQAALATEALDYAGAEALHLGMVDGVGHPNTAFEAFIAAVRPRH